MKEDRSRHHCPFSVTGQDMTSAHCSCPSSTVVQREPVSQGAWDGSPRHPSAVPIGQQARAGRAQAAQGCLQGHSVKREHSNTQAQGSQLTQGHPDAYGEVGTHMRTTATSMTGSARPVKEGQGAEAQAQRSHTLLQRHELCSSTSTSPLSHTALPRARGQTTQGSLALDEAKLAICS